MKEGGEKGVERGRNDEQKIEFLGTHTSRMTNTEQQLAISESENFPLLYWSRSSCPLMLCRLVMSALNKQHVLSPPYLRRSLGYNSTRASTLLQWRPLPFDLLRAHLCPARAPFTT